MTMLLNIGLMVGDNIGYLFPEVVYKKVSEFATVKDTKFWTSDSEDTMVLEIARPLTQHELFILAETLHQGAIAQNNNGIGLLVGPKANRWGPFDPAKFVMLDGERANASHS